MVEDYRNSLKDCKNAWSRKIKLKRKARIYLSKFSKGEETHHAVSFDGMERVRKIRGSKSFFRIICTSKHLIKPQADLSYVIVISIKAGLNG